MAAAADATPPRGWRVGERGGVEEAERRRASVSIGGDDVSMGETRGRRRQRRGTTGAATAAEESTATAAEEAVSVERGRARRPGQRRRRRTTTEGTISRAGASCALGKVEEGGRAGVTWEQRW